MADKFRTEDTPLTGSVLYTIQLPEPLWFAAEVMDLLRDMTYPFNWVQEGNVTVEQAANASAFMYMSFQPMTGQIVAYCTTSAPSNCLDCDGGTYNRVDYPNLYAALDSAFIIDADTFAVPDLRGRTVIGVSTAFTIGSVGGEEEHTLIEAEMPAHNHDDTGHAHSVDGHTTLLAVIPGDGLVSVPGLPTSTGTGYASIGDAGGNEAHNNMQPYIALKYAIVT